MNNVGLKILGFLVFVILSFQWIGWSITEMTGGEKKAATAVEVGPEGGESIYWGKGRCFTCHSVGGQGSAVRGPNHGQFGEKFPEAMGARAIGRAKERSDKTGQAFTATDYLVESLADPGAYVVDGYKNEMAVVFAPPISLNLDEIKAVVAYLQVQGGDLDIEAMTVNVSEVSAKFFNKIKAASAAGGGDPDAGAVVFEDNCMECHMIGEEGEELGPDLTKIGLKKLDILSDDILLPAKAITLGYDTYTVEEKDGRKTIGIKTADEAASVEITKATGDAVSIDKANIKTITKDENASIMPDDLSEAMTVKDFQDLMSFLVMQKGEEK